MTEDEGETTVVLPRLGILGLGTTREQALRDALVELRAYTRDGGRPRRATRARLR